MLIKQIEQLPDGIEALVTESKAEGYRFLERLVAEFVDGSNRFAQSGEALFAVFNHGRLMAIGGLNRDPYAEQPDIGRVRRVYVVHAMRGAGVGKALMQAIEQHAAGYFAELHLFTDTRDGALFYERLGYLPAKQRKVSHAKRLTGATASIDG